MSKWRGLRGLAVNMSAHARAEYWLGAGNSHQGSHSFGSRFEVCAGCHGHGLCILGCEQHQSQIDQDESDKPHWNSGSAAAASFAAWDIVTQQSACRFKEYLCV
ncbi:hypothetical protein GGD65_004016 [Bradyrhizobium sp. CIR18]|uniref:hypothetical protein n=1 Tax=Bradyrhizobium sp. CIR18 TaxID=2663839 RepID=UPI0016061C54|nr:hypothetical protein [Bradyrhizobium sp. CIR18]MBB4362983.1 hypothetical protein [Bradyrhizobium sp. CIR18]